MLQQYSVRLPPGWDPETAYPVVIYLHRYSPQPAMWYTSLAFTPASAEPDEPSGDAGTAGARTYQIVVSPHELIE